MERILEHEGIIVRPWKVIDLTATYLLLVIDNPLHFSDDKRFENQEQFATWFFRNVNDAVSGVSPNGNLVAVGYIEKLIKGHKASFSGAYDPIYQSPKYSLVISGGAVHYFMEKYDLIKMDTFTPVTNRLARLHDTRLGFKRDGLIRKMKRHNGGWADYCHFCVLREELRYEGLHQSSD